MKHTKQMGSIVLICNHNKQTTTKIPLNFVNVVDDIIIINLNNNDIQ